MGSRDGARARNAGRWAAVGGRDAEHGRTRSLRCAVPAGDGLRGFQAGSSPFNSATWC